MKKHLAMFIRFDLLVGYEDWNCKKNKKDFAGYTEMVTGSRACNVLLEDPSSPVEARGKLLSLFFLT